MKALVFIAPVCSFMARNIFLNAPMSIALEMQKQTGKP